MQNPYSDDQIRSLEHSAYQLEELIVNNVAMVLEIAT